MEESRSNEAPTDFKLLYHSQDTFTLLSTPHYQEIFPPMADKSHTF